MTVEQIAKQAALDVRPTEKLSMPEWLLFYRLRDLYRKFSKGSISKEIGAEEKARILMEYKRGVDREQASDRFLAHHAMLWKNIEMAANCYKENKTIENADKFVEAVYRVKMEE